MPTKEPGARQPPGSARAFAVRGHFDRFSLGYNLLQEDFLRRQLRYLTALRENDRGLWRRMEADRVARNRETAVLNRRLRAAGLDPVALDLSLNDRMKKLKALEAYNRAETAKAKRHPLRSSRRSVRHTPRTTV